MTAPVITDTEDEDMEDKEEEWTKVVTKASTDQGDGPNPWTMGTDQATAPGDSEEVPDFGEETTEKDTDEGTEKITETGMAGAVTTKKEELSYEAMVIVKAAMMQDEKEVEEKRAKSLNKVRGESYFHEEIVCKSWVISQAIMTHVVAIPGLKVLSSKTDTYKGIITLKILVEYDNQALGRLVRQKILTGAIEDAKRVRSTERKAVVGFDKGASSSDSKGTDKKNWQKLKILQDLS